jgi:hypothetical protein
MLIMGATRAHCNYVKSADTGGVAGAVLERKKRTLDEIRRLAPGREGRHGNGRRNRATTSTYAHPLIDV